MRTPSKSRFEIGRAVPRDQSTVKRLDHSAAGKPHCGEFSPSEPKPQSSRGNSEVVRDSRREAGYRGDRRSRSLFASDSPAAMPRTSSRHHNRRGPATLAGATPDARDAEPTDCIPQLPLGRIVRRIQENLPLILVCSARTLRIARHLRVERACHLDDVGEPLGGIVSIRLCPCLRPQCAIKTGISHPRRTCWVKPPKIHSRNRLWP
jgi:hypothetical protein